LKVLALIAFSILLLIPAGAQNALAVTTVTFHDDGTFTTPSIVESGLTVTGSNTLNILNFNGLGVVGGSADFTIDAIGNEFVTFDFSGTATNVIYVNPFAGQVGSSCVTCNTVGEAQIEAFDSGGSSLGIQNVDNPGSKDVSALFGNVPISHFTVTMLDADSIVIKEISFNLVQAVGGSLIPIDSTALLVTGAQINASWMIPAIVSAIGIGIVIARKF